MADTEVIPPDKKHLGSAVRVTHLDGLPYIGRKIQLKLSIGGATTRSEQSGLCLMLQLDYQNWNTFRNAVL